MVIPIIYSGLVLQDISHIFGEMCIRDSFPSTSKDGEYVFKLIDKDFLDPLDILNKYSDCKDESLSLIHI